MGILKSIALGLHHVFCHIHFDSFLFSSPQPRCYSLFPFSHSTSTLLAFCCSSLRPHPTPHCNWEHACVQAALRCICTHPQKPCQRAVTLGSQVHVSKETNSQVQNPGTARSRECPVGEPVSEVAQLCLTLCYPVDCSPPGSSLHGIFQARVLEWGAISFSRGSSRPRDQTQVSCIVRKTLYLLSHQGSPSTGSPVLSLSPYK